MRNMNSITGRGSEFQQPPQTKMAGSGRIPWSCGPFPPASRYTPAHWRLIVSLCFTCSRHSASLHRCACLQHRSGETGVVFHTNRPIIWADDLGQLWLKSGEGVNKETPQEPPVITAHSFKHSEWYWKMKRIPRWKTGSTIWSTVKPPLPVHSPWKRESIRPGQVNQQQSPKVNPTTRAYCSKGLWRVHEGLRTTTNSGSLNIYHWISAAKCQSECQLAWQMTMLLDSAEFEDPNAIKMVVRWVWILNRQTQFFSRQQNQETSYHWL